MTTKEVAKTLQCTERFVVVLTQRQYPEGHPKAGLPVLGDSWRLGRYWRFNDDAVAEYKRWLIMGCPIAAPAVELSKIEERFQRAASRAMNGGAA